MQFYRLATVQGHTEPLVNLGQCREKEFGLSQNSKKAICFYVLGDEKRGGHDRNPLRCIDKSDTEDGDCDDNIPGSSRIVL